MNAATSIIPTPPAINKLFNASIVVLLCALALALGSAACLPHKKHPYHLTENQLLRQHCHRQRKDHSSDHSHERNRHLHNPSSNLPSNPGPAFFAKLVSVTRQDDDQTTSP